jgi:hypothetical protein
MAESKRTGGIRPVLTSWLSSRGGADGKHRLFSRVVMGGVAAALVVVGLVEFAAPAFAHDNIVSAQASCASPLGSGYTIVWTIANDYNLAESGSVTSVTGGLSTLNSTTFNIAASPGEPYSSTTITQTLPATASGTISMVVSARWSDGFTTSDTGSFDLSSLSCSAPTQTIAGHIYLCNDSNPTTTEVSGGTLATSGPTTLPATPNPLAPTGVPAGGYTMTATAPPGYVLVVCTGSSTPNASGSTATEAVTVPSGGTGVGIFYVAPSSQTIAGHIYLCTNGSPTTTEVSGGTLATSGPTTLPATPNPLAPTGVPAGGYTMTATAPPGYVLVVCTGSSTPNASGSTATEAVTVPSGGAAVGIFYVVATATVATSPTTTGSSGTSGVSSSPSTSPSTTSPTSSVTTSPLAFTGAPITWELLIGLVLVLAGSALVIIGRRRRDSGVEGRLRMVQSSGKPGPASTPPAYPLDPGTPGSVAAWTSRTPIAAWTNRILRRRC